ncbi:penicillin-binding protein activator [candidate division KSB1 bacterium]|nr:penicillin-binding protein activator [candidate division KSB1 bacterium]
MKRKLMTITLFTFFSLLWFCNASISQTIESHDIIENPEAARLFNQGVELYRNKDYTQAKQIFTRLAYELPTHQHITSALFMTGKSNYKLGNYDQAIEALNKIKTDYKLSNYLDDSYYVIAKSYYRKGEYYNSVREFLWIIDNSTDKKIIDKSRNLSLQIIEYDLSLQDIMRLEQEFSEGRANALLRIKHAQRLTQIGQRNEAISILESFLDDNPRHEFSSVTREVLKDIRNKDKVVNLKIGVILPLSSEFASQAEAILRGIKYAVNQQNNRLSQNIELIVKDTEGNIMNCIEAAQDLVRDERVIGIIGELESEKTASITPLVNQHKIPLLPPIAFENGLAELSEYVYQINGNLDSRGELLAEYAFNELGHRTFATLSPADNYGKRMTDSFTATIDQLGGEIIAQKWYYENTEDLVRQFESMRELGMRRMNKDSLYRAYTRGMNEYQKARFDMGDIPVTSIDAMFCPIYTEDIQYIIPQLAFSNIRSQIIGGQYWYDTDELRAKNVQSHAQNLIFISSYFLDDHTSEFYNFKSAYTKATSKVPDAMDLAGYDSMLLLLDALKHNVRTRGELKEYLDNIENFQGIRGPITFKNNGRVNKDQRIIEYTHGQYKVLK